MASESIIPESVVTRAPGSGRGIAVFPGAFRPPHINHYITVADLAARSDVDEVVVVVANRARTVPGTTKALDVDVALKVWEIYLRTHSKVRVEVAASGAVPHALGYVDRCDAGDRLFLCTGKDADRADSCRMHKAVARAAQRGVSACVVPGSPNVVDVHATALRALLADGECGRHAFEAALPPHLCAQEREAVWRNCKAGMVEFRDVVQARLRRHFCTHSLGQIRAIEGTRPGKVDEVFRIVLEDDRRVFVKRAHDTVSAAGIGEAVGPKPRKRLKAERGALKYVAAVATDQVAVPHVVHFDKPSWTLVLSQVRPGGRPLRDDLESGRFDVRTAGLAANFLARVHTLDAAVKPLRDDAAEDAAHWRAMLALRTSAAATGALAPKHRANLLALESASNAASQTCLVHLDFRAKNILVSPDGLGVIDFESSASQGDPAYDLGLFVSDYLRWGLEGNRASGCGDAVTAALASYRAAAPQQWRRSRPRIAAFAGACLLHGLSQTRRPRPPGSTHKQESIALELLSAGPHSDSDPEVLMRNALN